MKIYAIGGLGADSRVFKYLKPDHELVPINWIKPQPKESLSHYSERLSKVIDADEEFAILGVSFGGLVAIEISKLLKPEFTILISSVETRSEIRLIYRWVGKIGILNWLPTFFFNPPRHFAHYLFGAKNTSLLDEILDDTDPKFTKWALNEFVKWDQRSKTGNVIRIHGTKDRLIPWRGKEAAGLVNGGGHFMIVDKSDEISQLINELINWV